MGLAEYHRENWDFGPRSVVLRCPLRNYPSGERKRHGGLESGTETRWALRGRTGSAGTSVHVLSFEEGGAPSPLQNVPLGGRKRRGGREKVRRRLIGPDGDSGNAGEFGLHSSFKEGTPLPPPE